MIIGLLAAAIWWGLFAGVEASPTLNAAINGGGDGGGNSSTVLLIGDSLGVGLSDYLPYQSAVQISTTVGYWLPRIAERLNTLKPSTVLISLGTNCENDFTARAQRLVETIQAHNARAVWLAPPVPCSTNGTADGIFSSGAEVLSIAPQPASGVHPSGAQYRSWAQAIQNAIGG